MRTRTGLSQIRSIRSETRLHSVMSQRVPTDGVDGAAAAAAGAHSDIHTVRVFVFVDCAANTSSRQAGNQL